MSTAAIEAPTVPTTDPTTFDFAVGTAAQQQSARLREFFPQLSRVEDDTYRRLLQRLA